MTHDTGKFLRCFRYLIVYAVIVFCAAAMVIWYKLNVVLNGTHAEFFIDGTLIEARDDIAIKEGNEYIALNANGKGVA